MKITDELIQKSNGLIGLHPEVNDWTGKNFVMFDDGGVELEVGEFLYGLVRVLKPEKILETGTYTGISAMYMAQGLKDNGMGDIVSLEVDRTHKERAEELWRRVGLSEYARSQLESSEHFESKDEYDLLFLDSEPQYRFGELVKFFPHLKPGGYVFIHDLHRHMSQQPNEKFFGWPFGALPTEIENWVKDGQLRPFHFPTPRGFMGFYKPDPRDYKWI